MTEEPPRRVKKSDTLQVRLPHETKKSFLESCREDGVAASDLIRNWIDGFLSKRQRPSDEPAKGLIAMIPKPIRKRRYLAAGIVLAGATLVAVLPSAADDTFRTMFDQLDANRDGRVTEIEFMAMAKRFPELNVSGPAARFKLSPEDRKDSEEFLRKFLAEGRDKKLPQIDERGGTEFIQDQVLLAFVKRGDRKIESLSDEELMNVTPAHKEPTNKEELCAQLSALPISDAEFANPWMNSDPDDFWKMYVDGDRNKDGVVTFEEFQISQTETARLWFNGMDKNSDGALSNADFELARAKMEKRRAKNPDKYMCPPKSNPRPRWLPLDTNRDGAVTFEEYLVPAQVLDPR